MACMAFPHPKGTAASGCDHAEFHALMESGVYPSLRFHLPSLSYMHALQPWVENLTGTRGAYRPYNTVKPKIEAWQPKVAQRGTPLQ
jgi:hypothetical protein